MVMEAARASKHDPNAGPQQNAGRGTALSDSGIDRYLGLCYKTCVGNVRLPDDVMKYFQMTGSMGGKARAKNHSKEQLSAWAKLGGRPKGSGKKSPATTATK